MVDDYLGDNEWGEYELTNEIRGGKNQGQPNMIPFDKSMVLL